MKENNSISQHFQGKNVYKKFLDSIFLLKFKPCLTASGARARLRGEGKKGGKDLVPVAALTLDALVDEGDAGHLEGNPSGRGAASDEVEVDELEVGEAGHH